MDERMKFIGRLLQGEKMAVLCREFGITRTTGYKIAERYKTLGPTGISDRSRAPYRHPNETPFDVQQLIIRLKKERPHWGAPKIRSIISTRHSSLKAPAISTIHEILDRHGLVRNRKARTRYPASASYLSTPTEPNDLWCTDFKGEFKLGNGAYCYPLTITDFASRFLLCCESQSGTKEIPAMKVFEEVFKEYGLPAAIRSDHGIPFASGNSMWNLTKLSVWWIRLGIKIERTEPGCPQQNGRHERMHRTLKLEATKPPAFSFLQQQEKFYRFQKEYNFERPHQALQMKRPGDIYENSRRLYTGISDITYPGDDKTLFISNCGRICTGRMKVHVTKALANQPVGLKQVEDGVWSISFMSFEIGFFDEHSMRFAPKEDPFGFKLPQKTVIESMEEDEKKKEAA